MCFDAVESGDHSRTELLYLFDDSQRPIGALVNVLCPAQILESKPFISSDLWGKARDFVKQELGDEFVVVGLCSVEGERS